MQNYCFDLQSELQYILCGRLDASEFVHMRRNLNIVVLIIVEEGILNIKIEDQRYKVGKGEWILLPPGKVHTGFRDADTPQHIRYFWVHFSVPKTQPASLDEGSLDLPLHHRLSAPARMSILYNHLMNVSMLSQFGTIYCRSLLTALLCELAEQFRNDHILDNKLVNRAITLINLNIHLPLSLDIVAEMTGYHKRYLSRVFKEHMHCTINEYITEQKMILAKQILSGTDSPIAEVAHSLGYSDPGYFMRLFKKHEGITCRQYRNAYTKMYMNEF